MCRLSLVAVSRGYSSCGARASHYSGFPGGAAVKDLPANAGDTGSISNLGKSHMPWSN